MSPSRPRLSRLPLTLALAALVTATHVTLAAGPDANALYWQGIKALNGDGQAVDLQAGRDLLEKSAAAGNTAAMQRLGELNRDGDGGLSRDYAKAFEWFKKAADQGAPRGMIGVAGAYETGNGVTRDPSQAEEWYKKALSAAQTGAAKGDSQSMIALSALYMTGKGSIKADPVIAWKWAIKATEQPGAYPYELMAVMYSNGIGVDRDQGKALQNLFKAAQLGSSGAMLAISDCYAQGVGVNKDPDAAMEYVQKAVERGNTKAMAKIGTYFHAGMGVKRDDNVARDWFQKAIDRGDAAAYGYMGELYNSPDVVFRNQQTATENLQKGADAADPYSMYLLADLFARNSPRNELNPRVEPLLRQAAEKGYGEAMNAMGELYRAGRLTDAADQSEAISWFKKASDAETPSGMRNLGEIWRDQGIGNRYSTTDDKPQLLKDGIASIKRAAEAGDAEAMADLGDAYATGTGVPLGGVSAMSWYKKGMDAGSIRATRNLGLLYWNGKLTGRDPVQAFPLLQKAAQAGDPAAMSGLGEIYEQGMQPHAADVPAQTDVETAVRWYQRAAQLNDAVALRDLGRLYQDGTTYAQTTPADQRLSTAVGYYERAATLGDAPAMESLGRMLELGQGVPKNMPRAIYLFQQAYRQGSTTARDWLLSHDVPMDPATAPATQRGRGGPAGGTGTGRGPAGGTQMPGGRGN